MSVSSCRAFESTPSALMAMPPTDWRLPPRPPPPQQPPPQLHAAQTSHAASAIATKAKANIKKRCETNDPLRPRRAMLRFSLLPEDTLIAQFNRLVPPPALALRLGCGLLARWLQALALLALFDHLCRLNL